MDISHRVLKTLVSVEQLNKMDRSVFWIHYLLASEMKKNRLRGTQHKFGSREINWEITAIVKCEMIT